MIADHKMRLVAAAVHKIIGYDVEFTLLVYQPLEEPSVDVSYSTSVDMGTTISLVDKWIAAMKARMS